MSTSLTKEYLLLSAGEFDIETIFHLELDNRDVQRMMGLQICTNIVRVDLSRNQIIRIEALENLSKLQFLDLSHNKLSKLAGIGSATGLETLRILNNPISRNVDVADLAMCEKLRAVFFQGVNGKDCCPICLQPDYRSRMLELVPNLISLDGTIFYRRLQGYGTPVLYLDYGPIFVPCLGHVMMFRHIYYAILKSRKTINRSETEDAIRVHRQSCRRRSQPGDSNRG